MARKRKPPVGSRPGTLAIDPSAPPPRIHLIRYSKDVLEERDIDDVEKLRGAAGSDRSCWIDVQGLGDIRVIETLGSIFSIHPLALEDIVNVPTRPKSEVYDNHLLIVTRMLLLEGEMEVRSEQVTLILGNDYLLTFQERYGDVLDPVRARLRAGHKLIRCSGPDYLAYAVLDTIVDAYFPVIDHTGDRLVEAEDLVIEDATPRTLRRLHKLKDILLIIRRAVAPQRETVNSMIRDENEFLAANTRLFLRDTYDHCVMTSEAVETNREMVNGLMNTYISVVSNKMNEVMKTLTVVTSIFVPLTFVVGIYGMNFESMPELGLWWGYPALLVVMSGIALAMVLYFLRKGWIGKTSDPGEGDG